MESLTALADPTRRKIVEMLGRGERAAGEIAERFAVSGPAISQHLKVLRDAKLVAVRVDGQRRIYSLDPAGLDEIDDEISHRAAALRRERARLKSPDAIILATAQTRGRVLVTRNTKDFPANMPGIRVPYTL